MKRYTLQTLNVVNIASGTTAITDWKFGGCPITSITIPNTVTSIGIIIILVYIHGHYYLPYYHKAGLPFIVVIL